MALITCPECGGQISSTVNNCVHCGAKIKVCPECGEFIVGENKQCSKCGYQLVAKPVVEKKNEKNTDSKYFIGIADRCVNKLMSTFRIFSVFNIFLLIIGAFLIAYPLISVLTFDAQEQGLLELLKISEDKENFIIPGVICLAMFFIIGSLGGFISERKSNTFLIKEGLDICNGLKCYLQKDFVEPVPFKEKNAIKRMLEVYIKTNVSKGKALVSFILTSVCSIATFVLIGITIIDIIEGMIVAKMLLLENYDVFSFINIPIFVSICCIIVGGFIASCCIAASINKDIDIWVYSNLRELNNTYVTYLK